MAKPYIGISGWTFPGWRGKFYPKGLPQKDELKFASHALSSVEINGTFYSLQKPSSFRSWYQQAPEGFLFSVKGGQYVTHIRRLKEVETSVAFFFASGIFELKEKLGPILWQFPPNMMLKDDRFERFLDLLPKSTKAARTLLEKFKDRLRYPEQLEFKEDLPLRYAFELRHASFLNEKFLALLSQHGVAIVHAHAGEKIPYTEEITTDFVYVRLHGEGKQYKKGYPAAELKVWAQRIKNWEKDAKLKKIFCYFNNDAKVYSPVGAQQLLVFLQSNPKPKRRAA